MKKQKSEQYRIAHLEDIPVEDLDLDALFQVAPDRDEQLRQIREASAARLAEIDAETTATMQVEIATANSEREKSEQYRAQFIPGPSNS